MKKKVIGSLFFLVTVSFLLLLSGCEKLRNVAGTPVNFSVGTSSDKQSGTSSAPRTKVSYGEISGSEQEIDWVIGDKITVYCAQCEGPKSAEYVVNDLHPGDFTTDNYATIGNVGASGLKWGTGVHKFYSVYPGVTTTGVTATITGKDITGSIPETQTFGSVTGDDNKVVSPNMNYLYMVAKSEINAGESGDPVFLDFKPLSTVLEFTITNKFEETNSTMKINSISLISSGHALNGDFQVDMDQTGLYGRPKTTLSEEVTAASKKVTISFGGSPVELAYEKTLNFTLFLNPGNATEVDDLTFEIKGVNEETSESFTRRAKLEKKDKSKVTFPTHKKTRITGIMVPESVAWDIEGDIVVVPWDETTEREPDFSEGEDAILIDDMTNEDGKWS